MTQPREAIRASVVARDIPLSVEARSLLQQDQSPDRYLAALESRHLHADGLLFMSHWLPIREAVWWACQCVWHLHRPVAPSKAEEAALQAAVRWVVDPSEQNRRATQAAGETAGLETAAGDVAMAAFWSGGSISPPKLPVVEPPAGAAANTLAKGLLLATAGSSTAEQHQHRFLQLGYQIASGANRWERPVRATATT